MAATKRAVENMSFIVYLELCSRSDDECSRSKFLLGWISFFMMQMKCFLHSSKRDSSSLCH